MQEAREVISRRWYHQQSSNVLVPGVTLRPPLPPLPLVTCRSTAGLSSGVPDSWHGAGCSLWRQSPLETEQETEQRREETRPSRLRHAGVGRNGLPVKAPIAS